MIFRELERVKLTAFQESRKELESKWENLKKDLKYYKEEYYRLNNFIQQETVKYDLQVKK